VTACSHEPPAMNECTKRLRREFQNISRNPSPNIIAKPNLSNIIEWHYVIFGPEDSPFKGGVFHGKLKFPPEFPHKPPSIMMTTPNGRFLPDTRICLSMSDFHPEMWNPMWSVSSILTGLLSFMLENNATTGSMESTVAEKNQFAKFSMTFNRKNPAFVKHFPELLDETEFEKNQSPSPETSKTRWPPCRTRNPTKVPRNGTGTSSRSPNSKSQACRKFNDRSPAYLYPDRNGSFQLFLMKEQNTCSI